MVKQLALLHKLTPFKRKRLIYILILTAIVVIGFIPTYIFFQNIYHSYQERIIDREFHADIQQYPTIALKKFMLWEGDSMADIEIKGKGLVSMWYGIDKVPRITSIGVYNTSSFDCFYVDSHLKKLEYAFTLSLNLDKNSLFKNWFPFQVNSIKDLLRYHDNIVEVLTSFPRNPPLTDFNDFSGSRKIRKTSDEKFMIKTQFNNKPVVCDLFFSN